MGGVETWWDVTGGGEPLVLLHPGGADSRAFDANLGLAAHVRVFRFDRRGQGRTQDVGGPITFADMTDDAIAFLEKIVGARLPLRALHRRAGRLLVAPARPDLVRGFVFSEGVFHHDGWKEGVLDPLPDDVHEFLGGLYGEVSPHGADHWPDVWARLDAEHHRAPALTVDDLARIRRRRCCCSPTTRRRCAASTSSPCSMPFRRPSSASSPARATACPPTSPSCATAWSLTSWRR